MIFDVDGVLVDVRESFWRSALETMRLLTGKRVTWAEFYRWKNKPGNNDDWRMVSNWATAVGRPTTYEEARDALLKTLEAGARCSQRTSKLNTNDKP